MERQTGGRGGRYFLNSNTLSLPVSFPLRSMTVYLSRFTSKSSRIGPAQRGRGMEGGEGGYRGEGGEVLHQPPPPQKKSGFCLPSPLLPSYISRCLLSFAAETATRLMHSMSNSDAIACCTHDTCLIVAFLVVRVLHCHEKVRFQVSLNSSHCQPSARFLFYSAVAPQIFTAWINIRWMVGYLLVRNKVACQVH